MIPLPQQKAAPLFNDVLEQHNQSKAIMSSLIGGTTKVDVPPNDLYGANVAGRMLNNRLNQVNNAQTGIPKGTKSFGGRGKKLRKNTWKRQVKLNSQVKLRFRNKTRFRRKHARAQSAVSRRLKR